MTTNLEDRLRRDLPKLAELLGGRGDVVLISSSSAERRIHRLRWYAGAAAALMLAVGGGYLVARNDDGGATTSTHDNGVAPTVEPTITSDVTNQHVIVAGADGITYSYSIAPVRLWGDWDESVSITGDDGFQLVGITVRRVCATGSWMMDFSRPTVGGVELILVMSDDVPSVQVELPDGSEQIIEPLGRGTVKYPFVRAVLPVAPMAIRPTAGGNGRLCGSPG